MAAEIHIRDASISSSSPSPRVKPSPKKSDIPVPFFYTSSNDGTDENLLILLHGLGRLSTHSVCHILLLPGDTHIPFTKLGRQLKLPQTAILTLRAPEQ